MRDYLLGLYEKAMPGGIGWSEKLRTAGEAGFDYVEMSIDETDEKQARLDMDRTQRRELLLTMGRAGVPIRSICLSAHRKYPMGSPDPETRRRSMEIMERAVELAADLGVRTIQLAGYDVYYEPHSPETEALFAENLVRAAEMAAREGVSLGFETMETPFMDTVAKAMRYVSAVNSPYLGVYPDIGNLSNAAALRHTDAAADLLGGRGHLLAVHLKETVPGKYREVPFGTGAVDFPRMIGAAWSLGVRRYVTELWRVDDEWREAICDARARMRAILDDCAAGLPAGGVLTERST